MSGHQSQSIKLKFGLNKPRTEGGTGKKVESTRPSASSSNRRTTERPSSLQLGKKNVLMESDDDNFDDDGVGDDRRQNKKGGSEELLAHQDALRRRAERALEEAKARGDDMIYDYDSYVTTEEEKKNSNDNQDEGDQSLPSEKPKSKYIAGLLKNAQKRQNIIESVIEKQKAKQMKEEEAENEELYGDKERFVTKSYKRKLQERQRWIEEEEAQEKRDNEMKNAIGGKATDGFVLGSSSMVKAVVDEGGYADSKEETIEGNGEKGDNTAIDHGLQSRNPSGGSTAYTEGSGNLESAKRIGHDRISESDAELERRKKHIHVLKTREEKLSKLRKEYFARMEERGLSHLLKID